MNTHDLISSEYRGAWRITGTSQWSSKFLDILDAAVRGLVLRVVIF